MWPVVDPFFFSFSSSQSIFHSFQTTLSGLISSALLQAKTRSSGNLLMDWKMIRSIPLDLSLVTTRSTTSHPLLNFTQYSAPPGAEDLGRWLCTRAACSQGVPIFKISIIHLRSIRSFLRPLDSLMQKYPLKHFHEDSSAPDIECIHSHYIIFKLPSNCSHYWFVTKITQYYNLEKT